MNKKNYKMKIFFSFALFFIFILNLLIVYQPTYAQDYKLGVPIGDTSSINFNQTTKPIATYISAIYKYAIGVVGILATIVLMYGGVRWIIAGGNAEAISSAKSWIAAALTGLVLILTSYMILYTINPSLVNLKTSKLKSLSENKSVNCCSSKLGAVSLLSGCNVKEEEKSVYGNIVTDYDPKEKMCAKEKGSSIFMVMDNPEVYCVYSIGLNNYCGKMLKSACVLSDSYGNPQICDLGKQCDGNYCEDTTDNKKDGNFEVYL